MSVLKKFLSPFRRRFTLAHPLGTRIVLTLPRNDGFGDALRRLSEAVNLVAFLEDRDPESLMVDLRDRSVNRQV